MLDNIVHLFFLLKIPYLSSYIFPGPWPSTSPAPFPAFSSFFCLSSCPTSLGLLLPGHFITSSTSGITTRWTFYILCFCGFCSKNLDHLLKMFSNGQAFWWSCHKIVFVKLTSVALSPLVYTISCQAEVVDVGPDRACLEHLPVDGVEQRLATSLSRDPARWTFCLSEKHWVGR